MKGLFTVVAFICAVAICEPAFGQNPLLKELNGKVVRLYEQGSCTQAAELAEEALRMAERELGQDNLQLITFLNNLAAIYYAQEKYAEAKLLYERALGLTDKGFGNDEKHVTLLMNGVEKCRQKQREREKAGLKDEPVLEFQAQYSGRSGNERITGESAKNGRDSADDKLSQRSFTVQVGAFRSLSSAKSLQERLYERGYGAHITSSAPNGGEILHKVQVGEFSEISKAIAASDEIRNNTGLKAFITRN